MEDLWGVYEVVEDDNELYFRMSIIVVEGTYCTRKYMFFKESLSKNIALQSRSWFL